MRARALRTVAALVALAGVSSGGRHAVAATGGTQIVNAATATYADSASHVYSTTSNAVVSSIAKLSALVASPKETSPNPATECIAAGSAATRVFTITNTSNIPDAYQLDKLTAGSLTIVSAAWQSSSGPIATGVNGAVSPAVDPGASVTLRVTIATTGLSVGANVPVQLGVHTTTAGTATGIVSDTAQAFVIGATGASLTGKGGNGTPIGKTVNQTALVQAQPGNSVMFDITVRNSGGSAATNVVVHDDVPAGLSIIAGSAQIDGQPAGANASVNGQNVTFTIPALAPSQSVDASFQAQLPPGSTIGESFSNVASVSADNLATQQTTPANVLAGQANIVFDGLAGSNRPVGGARVTLLDAQNNPVTFGGHTTSRAARPLSAGASATNPYTTGSDGTYGFALDPADVADGGTTFYLTIAASGYLNRKIRIDLTPSTQHLFYDVRESSMDGQPLAVAGGFTLTTSNVRLNDVFGLFGNLPLFASRSIVVDKSVDKQAAQAGDRLRYRVSFSNASAYPIGATAVVDSLPAGLVYLTGSARLDDAPLEPSVEGRTLTWNLASLDPNVTHEIDYAATIFGTAAAGTDLTNVVAVRGQVPASSTTTNGTSAATVRVIDGPFSTRRVVTGRVFIDRAHTEHFAKGDTGVAGVRIYLEDGSYVVTDQLGRFSFPAVRPGEHVLRIDPLTLPGSVAERTEAPMNSNRSYQRLLHGVLDDATMEDVEFALEPLR